MTNSDKQREEEEYIFKKFAESYKDLPAGNADFKDKPDVIYTTENGEIIGIEITESIYSSKLKSHSVSFVNFNNDVLRSIENEFKFTFILDIEIDNNYPIKLKFRQSIINEIKRICVEEFSDLLPLQEKKIENFGNEISNYDNETQELIIKIGFRNLPNSISSITMKRVDNMNKSYCFEINIGEVPEFTDKMLTDILEKKHKSLLDFKQCDKNWLLISEAMDFFSYFSEINITNNIETNFDKIFIYRGFSSEIIVIK
ncbi:hypothetical protein [Chryseobacterium sp. 'Rf worker isolate 10']|uniref:hypothetical protein n=1 Tax=Chryseobacterium sp. 'Rf worker isolate 10' TaxID=2887348 RepID=UPI003D7006A3